MSLYLSIPKLKKYPILNQKQNKFFRSAIIFLLVLFFLLLFFSSFPNNSVVGNFFNEISQLPSKIFQNVSGTLPANNVILVDSWGRAKVMSPRGRDPIKTVAELNGKIYGFEPENKAGLNNAIPLNRESVKEVYEVMEKNNITISYVVGMTTDPGDVGGAIEFIQESIDLGMLPIIRLCYDGGCNFNISSSADPIIDFFRAIAEQLDGTDYEFIAVLGPNEPGTGNEAGGFGVPPVQAGGYNLLVQRANEAAEALQEFRFENGGPMYLAPAIFNITNTQNDDVNAYLFGQFGNQINPTLFDYLLGNTYNLNEGDADLFFNEAIGNRPSSMKSYAESNDLKVIFTEFGFFTGGVGRLKESYLRLCNDPIVESINFFRPFPPNTLPNDTFTPRQDPPIQLDEFNDIVKSCQEIPERPGSRKRWVNANFDSCVPNHNFIPSVSGTVKGESTANNYIIPSGVCSILKDKKRNKVINFGDSLAEESSSTFSESSIVKYSFPGASTRWFVGEKPDITQQFNNTIVKIDAFAVRIIIGTNDIGSANQNGCFGIPDLNESVKNIQSIADKFRENGIIPIIVTVPARDSQCQTRLNELNSKIISTFSQFYPVIQADKLYSTSDLRDDRHLKDYQSLNNTTRSVLNKIIQTCQVEGVNFSESPLATEGNNDDGVVGTRYVNPDRTYGLGNHVSLSCGVEFESKDDSILRDRSKGPQFLLKCSGGGCNISWSGYIMVESPIKSLGSNNPTNSSSKKSYTPLSSYISTFVFGKGSEKDKYVYDSLNQFAWGFFEIGSNSNPYPMPWLGSIVNNASELIKLHPQFAKYLDNKTFNPVSFSRLTEAKTETQFEKNFNPMLAQKIVSSIYGSNYLLDGFIPDERAVCLINKNGDLKNFSNARCFDNRDIDILKTLKKYDFTKVSQNWKEVEVGSCGEQNFRYLNAQDEYIPGPEVKASEGSENFSNSEICWRFGNRSIHQDTKLYWDFKYDRVSKRNKPNFDFGRNGNPPSCTVRSKATVTRTYSCTTALSLIDRGFADPSNRQEIALICRPDLNRIPNVQIQEYCSSVINQRVGTDQDQNVRCDMSKGECNFPLDTKDVCFNYRYDANHETYIKNNSFPNFPEYKIPGINDALYHYYTFLNNLLSVKNLRFVFGDVNYGWKLKVNSILRDENKREDERYISSQVYNYPYLYVGESNLQQCVNDTTKFFDNKTPKARGRSHIVQYQYYPWLGTLDIMQEILSVYVNNTKLPDVEEARNPDGSLKLKNGKPFLQTPKLQDGSLAPAANLILSRPFLTCDERIACKEEKDLDEVVWCPIKDKEIRQLINEDLNYPCIDRVDSNGQTVNKYKDALSEYLCENGYIVEGVCSEVKLFCLDESLKSNEKVSDSGYEGFYCPLQSEHKCFQGPFGAYTHCNSQGLPLDFFTKITSDRSKRDIKVYVPEDGTIIDISPGKYRNSVTILGSKTGIEYHILHLNLNTVPRLGSKVKAGSVLGEFDQEDYEYNNWHIHIRATYKGLHIDPYLLFGEILKCNAKAPRPGMRYRSPAEEGMCVYGDTEANRESGIANTLNDNACVNKVSSSDIAKRSTIINLFRPYSKDKSNRGQINNNICSKCSLPPKNNISYPDCPNVSYTICQDTKKMNEVFADSSINLISNCDEKISQISRSIKTQNITFLGMEITVNSLIVDVLRKVELDIQKEAISYSANSYVFPSGPYTFISGGAFNPRIITGTENISECNISNHSWGTAIDINPATNPFTNLCSISFDMPPEVVKVFERHGFRWGGRFLEKPDYMHFEYCVDPTNFKPSNVENTLICKPKQNPPSSKPPIIEKGPITKEKILKLCSPRRIDWVDVSVQDVYTAYNKIGTYPVDPPRAPNRTNRIRQILEAARKQNINPAIIFAVWYTEGGYLGDSVAGGTGRGAYGFDFGCGLSPRCGIAGRDQGPVSQERLDRGFIDSLNCITKQGNKCKLACSYEAILSDKPYQIPRGPLQQPGLGGFLECYGPLIDNNPHFAKGFIKVYDAFFPPDSNHSHRRIQTDDCIMSFEN